MKKTFMLAFVLAAVTGLIFAGSAFAQGNTPPTFGNRGPADGTGLLHDYMSNAMAEVLGVSVEELQASHDAGETFYDFALASGYTADEITLLMQDARTSALNAALADGVITQEQFDFMQSRGAGRGGSVDAEALATVPAMAVVVLLWDLADDNTPSSKPLNENAI